MDNDSLKVLFCVISTKARNQRNGEIWPFYRTDVSTLALMHLAPLRFVIPACRWPKSITAYGHIPGFPITTFGNDGSGSFFQKD